MSTVTGSEPKLAVTVPSVVETEKSTISGWIALVVEPVVMIAIAPPENAAAVTTSRDNATSPRLRNSFTRFGVAL